MGVLDPFLHVRHCIFPLGINLGLGEQEIHGATWTLNTWNIFCWRVLIVIFISNRSIRWR